MSCAPCTGPATPAGACVHMHGSRPRFRAAPAGRRRWMATTTSCATLASTSRTQRSTSTLSWTRGGTGSSGWTSCSPPPPSPSRPSTCWQVGGGRGATGSRLARHDVMLAWGLCVGAALLIKVCSWACCLALALSSLARCLLPALTVTHPWACKSVACSLKPHSRTMPTSRRHSGREPCDPALPDHQREPLLGAQRVCLPHVLHVLLLDYHVHALAQAHLRSRWCVRCRSRPNCKLPLM